MNQEIALPAGSPETLSSNRIVAWYAFQVGVGYVGFSLQYLKEKYKFIFKWTPLSPWRKMSSEPPLAWCSSYDQDKTRIIGVEVSRLRQEYPHVAEWLPLYEYSPEVEVDPKAKIVRLVAENERLRENERRLVSENFRLQELLQSISRLAQSGSSKPASSGDYTL